MIESGAIKDIVPHPLNNGELSTWHLGRGADSRGQMFLLNAAAWFLSSDRSNILRLAKNIKANVAKNTTLRSKNEKIREDE